MKKGERVQPFPPADASKPPVQRLPQTHQGAALSLVDKAIVKSKTHRDRVYREPWEKSHPFIVDFYRRFQDELEMRGMPFYAHSFYRSNETQGDLYRRRVTQAPAGASPHNYGMAVDIVHSLRHWDLTDKEWEVIGLIGHEVARKANIKVRWGGDWNMNGVPVKADPRERFWDPAHWELADWKVRRDVGEHLIGWDRHHYSPGIVSKMTRKPIVSSLSKQ